MKKKEGNYLRFRRKAAKSEAAINPATANTTWYSGATLSAVWLGGDEVEAEGDVWVWFNGCDGVGEGLGDGFGVAVGVSGVEGVTGMDKGFIKG